MSDPTPNYVALADVMGLVPHVTLSATSKPSTADVTGFIFDCERDCNAALGNLGIITPVDKTASPVSWDIVRVKVAHAVVGRWLTSRALGAGMPADQGADVAAAVYTKWIKALADPSDPTCLPDALKTAEAVEKSTSLRQSSSSVAGLTDAEGFDPDTPAASVGQVF